MSLLGKRIGPYHILDLIGEGGMGQVYRANDTRLNRDVALKFLPEQFGADPDRLARFQREAQTLASLNHPNIATIHGVVEAGGISGLVMELIHGPTLAERLNPVSGIRDQGSAVESGLGRTMRGLPLAEVLPIARQIADALDAAHEKGIVHRDLKPANIILKGAWGPTPTRLEDGRLERRLSAADASGCVVKVLDFGLAKAMDPTGVSSVDASMSPTLSMRATQAGMILGTVPSYCVIDARV